MRLLVLAVSVVGVAWVSGCSTPVPPCDAQSCAGCCDPNGGCAVGDARSSCGALGVTCQSCRTDESCSLGQCVLSSGGGGGGATDGGGGATDGGAGDGGVDGGSCSSPDQLPIAQLTACSPAQLVTDPDCTGGATSFSLAAIVPAELTLSAVNSTDDHRVAQYRFTLFPPLPGGSTSAALSNNAVKIMSSKTKLTIPAGATGTWRVGLEVWDDCGQKAAATAITALDVFP